MIGKHMAQTKEDAETLEALRTDLAAAGWRIAKKPVRDATELCDWYAWKPNRPQDWPNCGCNDKPPSLTIKPYLLRVGERLHGGAEFSLCGQHDEEWYDLKLYSVRLEDVLTTIHKATSSLGAAWKAITAKQETTT